MIGFARFFVPGTTMTRLQYLAACLLLLNWSPAMAIGEPGYTIVSTDDAFEVRRYQPYVVAETVVNAAAEEAGNQGFRILAGYIFGQNKGARKIEMTAPVAQTPAIMAMTAPVAQSATSDGFMVQFAMPREWTLESLPEPTDSRVKLRAVPARTLAVIRYSGNWSQSNYDDNLKKLQDALTKAGRKWHGAAVWARYDPPWKPWFWRRNEILLEVD